MTQKIQIVSMANKQFKLPEMLSEDMPFSCTVWKCCEFAFRKTLATKNILLMHSLRGFLFCTPFVISIKEVVASMFYTRTIIIASRFVLFVCFDVFPCIRDM